jgi:sn-glycerol 3-phosphate transport system substrate-binding protein
MKPEKIAEEEKMKKFSVVLLVLFLTGVMAFAGGAGQQAGGSKTKVVFWHAMGGLAGETLNKFVADYNASQSAVEVEAQYQGNYDDAITKLRATPKGQGPDIMQLYEIGTRWAMDSGMTLKMQDFIKKDAYDISDYEPNILAYYTFGGELYSMPFNCSSPVIFYNKDALAKAGLDPKTAFATMDSCLATAKAVQASGLSTGGSFTLYSWVFEQLISIQDKPFLDNGNGRTGRATKVVANQELLNIFTKYAAIVRDPSNKIFGKGTGVAYDQFNTGTLGYTVGSSSSYSVIYRTVGNKFSTGIAPVPKVNPGDTGGISVGGGSLWLMDNDDSKRADAAWEFVKYVTGAEKQAEWSIGTGYLPIRRSAVNLPVFQDFIAKENPELIVAIEALRNSKPSCAGAVMGVFPKARVIIENEVETMINNPAVTPQQVVDRIVSQINEEIALYNRTN